MYAVVPEPGGQIVSSSGRDHQGALSQLLAAHVGIVNAVTRWGAEPDSRGAWLEVDLGTERTVSRAVINQEGWNRIAAFELQQWTREVWATFYVSPPDAHHHDKVDVSFPPVTTRRVRLNITRSLDVPTIWEFQLFDD